MLSASLASSARSSRLFFIGVFLVSGCLMALQILQSRIFSVTTWYHLAFLVISIAMFGMTLAALSVHRGDEAAQRRNYARMLTEESRGFGLYIIVALGAQLLIPIVYTTFWMTALTLPLLSLFTVVAYYKAGMVLTLALTRTPYPVARTYGVDLVGAAAGCLFALLLMSYLDGPSAVMVLAVIALAASYCFGRMEGASSDKVVNRKTLVWGGVIALVALLNVTAPQKLIYPFWSKASFFSQADLAHDEWNAISRVTVANERVNFPPFLWGASPLLPENMRASYYRLMIDGDAMTPITRFEGNKDALRFLEYDVTTIAYALPGLDEVAIIGVGGGRDVLTAHYFGASDITAMDVNNVQISLLTEKEPFRSYANIINIPGVKLIHSEARSWFSRHQGAFDLIQMSLIDTWAATGAGAFALSENGLYTADGWVVLLNDLDDAGVFTVSRWYGEDAPNETERLLSLATRALLDYGVERPRDHIFVATVANISTLVLAKQPFLPEQLAALKGQAEKRGFGVLVSPEKASTHEMFNRIVNVKSAAELDALADANPLDISPPTDNRPFFFNQVRLGNPLQVLALANSQSGQAIYGHARATLNLYLILVFALLMVVFVILRPLRAATTESDKGYIAAGTVWFLLIGLGFMLLEVALLQRMSIFLGHPVYGLGVVLFSLVLSAGIGSLLSEKYVLDTVAKRASWILVVFLFALGLALGIGPVFDIFAEASLFARATLCVLLAAPLGVLLGFGFPTGMMLAKAIDERPVAWFWGINGAAGVMGSALAVSLNIALGLNWTIILGGLCYALLLLPAAKLRYGAAGKA